MSTTARIFLVLACLILTASCEGTKKPPAEPAGKPPVAATPTPLPGSAAAPSAPVPGKAYRISGNIDEASQEGDVCDVTVPFTVPGTLKFEFTPSSATKGTYTYSGPFNANGSGPYEIYDNGKMLVDGKGCIMGKCAEYSHDWSAKPIDPATCGKTAPPK